MAFPGLWGVVGENGGMSLFSRTVDLPGVQAVMFFQAEDGIRDRSRHSC